ncbi:transferase family-domain-containing protein [Echria macrotheca]|uniref:Transferase family-domain-containing protein n=1 Tax=Echria macrotheca TaxID=438768 RepID=A0AAJ0FEJ2_9PEZI|nr:transferase family-domain-containing protein [Echria macrotheca]
MTSQPEPVYLSPLDQFMPRSHVPTYLVFPTSDPSAALETFQSGIDRLTTHLPFLRGRIIIPSDKDSRNRLALVSSPSEDTPVTLTPLINHIGVAAPSSSPDDQFTTIPTYTQLAAQNAPVEYFANPLPTLTAARQEANPGDGDGGEPVFFAGYALIEGAVIIAFAAHHGIVDGTGMTNLIRFWAECTSSRENPATAPRSDEISLRTKLLWSAIEEQQGGRRPRTTTQRESFEEILGRLSEFQYLSEGGGGSAPTQKKPKGGTRLFVFDVAKLEAARERLRTTGAGRELDKRALSTNNILMAVAWGCVTQARMVRLGGDVGRETSKLGFAINGRRFLGPTFAETERMYLGNINVFGLPEVDVSTLAKIGTTCDDEALVRVIEAVWDAIRRVTAPDHIGEVMTLMETAPDLLKVQSNSVRSHGPDLTATSWANMDIYGCDFGAGIGKPAFVRFPWFDSDGLIIMLPRRRGVGIKQTIEVVMAMNLEDMAFLDGSDVWKSWLVSE